MRTKFTIKKSLSLFLVIIMLITVAVTVNFSAAAQDNMTEAQGEISSETYAIDEDNIASITFSPSHSIEVIENMGGYLDTDDSGDEYYYYEISYEDVLSYDDVLTVTDKSGNSADYVYKSVEDEDCFISDDGDIIFPYDIDIMTNQYDTHWELGSDNYLTLSYMEVESNPVPVTVAENPIASIEFAPIKDMTIREGIDYIYFGNDGGNLNIHSNIGDKVTVNYKDGTTKVYYTQNDEDFYSVYVSEDGETLSSNDCEIRRTDDGYCQFVYAGVASNKIPITESKAVAVEFKPVSNIQIKEGFLNDDEYQEQEVAYWNGIDEQGNEFVYYATGPYGNEYGDFYYDRTLTNLFQNGDVLTITYDNGDVVNYTYQGWSYGLLSMGGYRFFGDNGTTFYLCGTDGVQIHSNQSTNHWTVGGDNYFTITCDGIVSEKIQVDIVDNSVHTHSYIRETIAPTCTEQGYTTYTCTCSDSYTDDYVDALGHSFGEWTYNGDAEYNSSTDYKNGTQTRKCTACDECETVEAPNTALLRRRGNALELESAVKVNVFIAKTTVDYYDEVYAQFDFEGDIKNVYDFKTYNSTYYQFDFEGIAPQRMSDTVKITFYGIKDGVKYWGSTYTYSITDYLVKQINSTTNAKYKTMLVDLLYYGAECQKYQDYKTDALMTDLITEEQKACRSTEKLTYTNMKNASYKTCENRYVRFGTALRLYSAVEVAVALNISEGVDINDLEFKVQIEGRDLTYSMANNPENFAFSGGYWYFYFDGVYANQLTSPVYITAYLNNEQVSYTLLYSVESYAATNTNTALQNVLDAMMHYGNSAKAYAEK